MKQMVDAKETKFSLQFMSTSDQDANTSTPMMQQYLQIKKQYKNEILFFRMGDFYEMFLDDAIYASKVLDIALTKRRDNIPMCGVPYHAMHNYVHQILLSGKNIAVCDQVEDPSTVSGRIVKREVTRVLTPGSIFEEELLERQETRKLAALVEHKKQFVVAVADIADGEIFLSEQSKESLGGYLHSHFVKEIIFGDNNKNLLAQAEDFLQAERLYRRQYPISQKEEALKKMFATQNLSILEISETEKEALYMLYGYVQEIAPRLKIRWKNPHRQEQSQMMMLDETALRTLEILQDTGGKAKNSLAGILNFTQTAAGKRYLSRSLCMPLLNEKEIEKRYDIVDLFLRQKNPASNLVQSLKACSDIERLLSSLENRPQVRHLGQLSQTLLEAQKISEQLAALDSSQETVLSLQTTWQSSLQKLSALRKNLQEALLPQDLPPLLDERRFVRSGYSAPLDELMRLNSSAQDVLHALEEKERKRLEVTTLRIKYNHVLGYFIEISKGAAHKAPPEYNRRQTLVGSERFTTQELKEVENKLLHAKEQVIDIQRGIFLSLVNDCLENTHSLRELAENLAALDMLLSFAQAASLYRYTRPRWNASGDFILQNARHPVIEVLFREEIFVPNDIHLNQSSRHLAILTGPNMSGKSTFIRQIGLIQIMAQAGCYVSAEAANLSICDRIFTRIGAYDRLAKGESTFYVEMSECAAIFRHYTPRSLILLDEVGRGTSTFDGISIARAMIEFFNSEPSSGIDSSITSPKENLQKNSEPYVQKSRQNQKPKVLFATHYAELAEMISPDQGIIGLTVSVLEEKDKVIFLRKIVEGKADKSYGIYVANMAGLPAKIIMRAEYLLQELQEDALWKTEPTIEKNNGKEKNSRSPSDSSQNLLF